METEPSPILERITAAEMTTAALKAQEPPPPLVDGYLEHNSTAVIYGPSGSSKTFLAIDLACHVATSSWWWGHEVIGGPVIYVIAEGAGRFGKRIEAWEHHHHRLDGHHPVHWITIPIHLAEPEWVGGFIEYAKAHKPSLIVFDTLARCIPGVEENSAKEMGRVIHYVDLVKRATEACVCLVHHSGVTEGRLRGSTAIKGSLDTEIEVSGTDESVTVKVTKQKDRPEPLPRHFQRIQVADSCALVPATRDTPDELPKGALATLEALGSVQLPGGVSSSVWKAAAPATERTFYNHRSRLVSAGMVQNLGTDGAPRYIVAEQGETDD